ncbi:protein LphB [Legionella rowbothamii]|uniref:protein LphB n=1 Tax=Legionella rowbothamii TaxID=96229 RepID=UPI001055BC19|nr:protein LphB [Legionella rowbothamii]
MSSLSSRKESWLAIIFAVYCTYYLIVSIAAAWGFTTDDAYITWLYARQLAEGEGINWPALLPRVEGYSNFLWLLMASLSFKLHWPVVLTMKWISVFSLGSALFFLYRLSRLFLSPLLAMLPVFIFSHYTGVVWWTVSGLESAFFCALSLLLTWQCAVALGFSPVLEQSTGDSRLSTRAWAITNISLLLLGLTRFEGIVWAVPVVLFIFCQWKSKRISTMLLSKKKGYLWGIITLVCLVLPYTIYFIWRVRYFGHWIPNSYQCKAFLTGQRGVVDLDYIRVIIPLIVASLPYLLAPKDCRHILLWLPSVLYGLMLWGADPVLAHMLRLFLAPFALFSLLAVLGVFEFLHYFNIVKEDLKLLVCFIFIFITFLLIPRDNLASLHVLANNYQSRNQSRLLIARLLNEQAAKGDTILLGDCGVIPFNARSDLRFIDSQCLNNAELTQPPYNSNFALYASYIREQVKPNWVIISKPVLEARCDFLINLLEGSDFLTHYQFVARFESGPVARNAQGRSQKTIDNVYLVYKRAS